MEAHMDLLEVPSEVLENFKNKHNELLTHVMRLLLDEMGSVDTKILAGVRKDLEQRVEAIEWIDARRKGKQRGTATSPITPSTISTLNVPSSFIQPSPQATAFSASFTSLPAPPVKTASQPMIIDLDEELDPEPPNRPQDPDSDEELWDSFGDMPGVTFSTDTKAPPPVVPAATIGHSQGAYMKEVRRQLGAVFGLKDFRPNQLEAISATLEGRDVFVLMPTGGGKSLCYQLPAVCTTGKTCGVTVVVSPLTALMEDQVSALTSKGVDAFFWSADSLQHEVSAKLFSGDQRPALLYVTPEKLRASSSCRGLLNKLYRQQQLARFAIDEAHCISTWGQDFRSAYQGLGQLRQDYPNVPIIALTATANERTREDIVDQLQLRNLAFFNQSFNRPNLKYYIKNKTKVLDDIVDFIQKKHANSSGVIYCLSRKSCEQVAGQLGKRGLRADFFHAGLSKEVKNRLLEDWKADKFRIIVATIAFGMGIDKPDVRFVIHHDLPKCMSGYYQETGRAGRDGKPADCVLYYSFKDFKTICWMIENDKERDDPLTPEGIERQKDAAREVVKYCCNISECRRVQVLRHFGQDFDQRDCQGGCDNCLDGRQLVKEDVTIVAINSIDIVQGVSDAGSNITVALLTQYLRGTNASKLRERGGLEDMIGFGTCKGFSKELVELSIDQLLARDILNCRRERQQSGYFTEYVELGQFASSFKKNRERFEVEWRPPPPKAQKPAKQNQERGGKGKRRTADTLGDDPIESFPDEENLSKVVGSSSGQSSLSSTEEAPFPKPMMQLYTKLDSLRHQIMIKKGLSNKASVASQALIEHLTCSCPRDYSEFDRMMNEASDEITPIFKLYHRDFAQVCVTHQLHASAPPLGVAEMHNRFAYQPA